MNKENKLYSMKETCNKTGLTYDALKFYCNEGLIPNVKRNKSNYRVFDDKDIDWINSLSCLKKCGMSITEMKEYLDLCLNGENTIPQRQDILDLKLSDLEKKKKEIEEAMSFINWKQKFYKDVLDGKTKYYSNLLREDD